MNNRQPPGRLQPTASAAQVLMAAKAVSPSVEGYLNGFKHRGRVVILKCRRVGMAARQNRPGCVIDRGLTRLELDAPKMALKG